MANQRHQNDLENEISRTKSQTKRIRTWISLAILAILVGVLVLALLSVFKVI